MNPNRSRKSQISNVKKKTSELSLVFFRFARHGRALTGESPEHAQIVGSV